MRTSVVALAAVAALVSSLATAGEVKQAQKPVVSAPAQTAPAQMSDAEMDKVTAGYYVDTYGTGTVYDSNVNYHARNNGFQGNNYHAACVSGFSC